MSLRSRIEAAARALLGEEQPSITNTLATVQQTDCRCAQYAARAARLSTMLDVRTSELITARQRIAELETNREGQLHD